MRTILLSCFFAFLAVDGFAQSPDPPISDTRLTVHTLVREDIFAGYRADNMERFERGEQNIDRLLEQRPAARADLLAWKGGTKLYRAVTAHEQEHREEFQSFYSEAIDLFAQARELAPQGVGVAAVVGGSYVLFADRLPEAQRADAWSASYDSYQVLWSQQASAVAQLPVHIRGELLSGLIQSSQRTGRTDELQQYLDKMIEVLPNTSYGRMAQQWKDDPQAAVGQNISCKSCHAPGRLAATLARYEGN